MKALSIRQPWAWLIVNGHKDVENRTWWTNVRGPVFVHASKGMTAREYDDVEDFLMADGRLNRALMALPPAHELERGGIVGTTEIVSCIDRSASPWYFGPLGFSLANSKPLPFRPLKGALGFFEVAP